MRLPPVFQCNFAIKYLKIHFMFPIAETLSLVNCKDNDWCTQFHAFFVSFCASVFYLFMPLRFIVCLSTKSRSLWQEQVAAFKPDFVDKFLVLKSFSLWEFRNLAFLLSLCIIIWYFCTSETAVVVQPCRHSVRNHFFCLWFWIHLFLLHECLWAWMCQSATLGALTRPSGRSGTKGCSVVAASTSLAQRTPGIWVIRAQALPCFIVPARFRGRGWLPTASEGGANLPAISLSYSTCEFCVVVVVNVVFIFLVVLCFDCCMFIWEWFPKRRRLVRPGYKAALRPLRFLVPNSRIENWCRFFHSKTEMRMRLQFLCDVKNFYHTAQLTAAFSLIKLCFVNRLFA